MDNNSMLGKIMIALTGIPQHWGLLLDVIEKISDSVFARELAKFARREQCWAAQAAPTLPDIDWPRVYKTLGMKFELGELTIPADPNFWDVYVMKGVTPNKVIAAFRELGVNVYTYVDDLDKSVPTSDRDPKNGSYRIRFKKTIEADPELANKSAEDLKEEKIQGITLLERLLLELGYFMATGEHLDVENITLCSGSRYSDGDVPYVCWGAGFRGLCVSWYDPRSAGGDLRARAAVS